MEKMLCKYLSDQILVWCVIIIFSVNLNFDRWGQWSPGESMVTQFTSVHVTAEHKTMPPA